MYAVDALKNASRLKNVIIVKRLPRFDRSNEDIIGIKSQLSTYANSVYDQLLIKRGNPNNIMLCN